MKSLSIAAVAFFSSLFPASAFASCANFEGGLGVKVIPLQNDKVKITSTYQVSVLVDDADEVIDALNEARAEARAAILNYMETKLAKDCKRNTNKITNIQTTAESKNFDIKKVKTLVFVLQDNAECALNGSVDVGQCYEPAKYVKLTVGIKPETIAGASNLRRSMKNSRTNNRSGSVGSGRSGSSSGSGSSGFSPVDGFSNYDSNF